MSLVVRQDPNCPPVYRNARDFFNATYLTTALKKLLTDVLKSLRGDAGDRVLQLRTPFGGGKTHSLISLYHITKNRSDLQSITQLDELPNPGNVRVAHFIGFEAGAIKGIEIDDSPPIFTPWGYLAWQLGGHHAYSLLATEDQQKVAPGNEVWRKILGDTPNLILIDELLVFVESAMAVQVGDSNFGRQVLIFIQKLTEIVRELPKTVLVYSLQASVAESFGNEGLLSALDKLVSRIDAKKEPVSGDEVMQVIQRRLFSNIGDTAIIQEVARQQAELFRRLRESYADTNREKQEIQQQADLLAERILVSYPFHPDLIDLMYYRWGTLPSYQRTRGALQFLAAATYALWQAKDNSWLITPGSIPFDNDIVKNAFFSQVGARDAYSSVLISDLTGRKAKVKTVDNRIAADAPALSHLKVGTRLSSAILMYSFGTRGGDKGVLEQEITSACLAPGLDRTTITAALSDLREELLHLHYVGQRYRFETKANLNKLIADEEGKVSSDEVLQKIQEELNKTLPNIRSKVVWPKDAAAIPDKVKQFSIVYLEPSWADKSKDLVLADALNWLENRGNDKREFKNALAFVVPNKAQMDKARKGARTALAISGLIEKKNKKKASSEELEEFNELASKAKDATSEIVAAVRRLYEYILLPLPDNSGEKPVRLESVDLQSQLNTSQNLQERVLDALKNYVFETTTASKLVSLSGLESPDKEYITGEELVSYFFRFPTLPKMLGVEGIKKSILKAIEQGLIGYVPSMTISGEIPVVDNPNLISFEKVIPADELDLAGYLLSPSLVNKLRSVKSPEIVETIIKDAEEDDTVKLIYGSGDSGSTTKRKVSEEKQTVEYKSDASSIERTVLVDIVNGKKPARYYKLTSSTDKAKIFQLFEVLQALSDKAEGMTITIEVQAHTQDSFDLNWIRNAIEEPLDEMDIQASTRLE
ncbi:ATP-binding protein [Nostoc sp. 'Peltigera membranacea cyanobiont' 232]|uniref:ATP-binding protein n=1 Tax=Nostoc sp. 'Peltigera membranacea cyanobiont' 232 TaxID=2014531 RepID=UPI0016734E13|nr:DUF499 domain-containing protein [Nostoc sp. 'Peltigera membranacea cyanobiont' 232]